MKPSELLAYLLDPKLRKNHVVDEKKLTITSRTFENESKEPVPLAGLFSDDNLKNLDISGDDLNRYDDYIHQLWLIRRTDFNFENKAYASAAYYCTQPDNSSRIKAIREKNSFDLEKEVGNEGNYQLSNLAISDMTSMLVLSQGLSRHGYKPVEWFRSTQESKKINKNNDRIEKLLEYLIDPKLRKSHSFDKNNLTITFYFSTELEETFSLQCFYYPGNLRNISMDNNLLNRYVDYIKNIIIPNESESKEKHPAHHYAEYYYSAHAISINKMFRSKNLLPNLSVKYQFTEITETHLNNINYADLEANKGNLEIFVVIITPKTGLPEIYSSHLNKTFTRENLIPLHEKILVRKYRNNLSDQIKKVLENYFNVTNEDINILDEKTTIPYIASSIILFDALKSVRENKFESTPNESYRYLAWDQRPFEFKFPNYVTQDPAFLSFTHSGIVDLSYNPYHEHHLIYSKNNPGISIKNSSRFPNENEILSPSIPVTYYQLNVIEKYYFFYAHFNVSEPDFPIGRPSEKIAQFAISYLMDNIYNREYKDSSLCDMDLNLSDPSLPGLVVYKPNHGILHFIRQLEHTPFTIDFFAVSAKDQDFKVFCGKVLRLKELVVLGETVNAIHLLTEVSLVAGSYALGRESEITRSVNAEKVMEYKKKSAKRFKKLAKHLEEKSGFKIHENRLKIYEWVLEKHETQDYQDCNGFKLWVRNIVVTTHYLDLPRCLSAEVLQKILNSFLNPIIKKEFESQIKYLINSNLAGILSSGDRISINYEVPAQGYDITKYILNSTLQTFHYQKLLRNSPRPIFSADEKEIKMVTNTAVPKMVEWFCTQRIVEDLQLNKNQPPNILMDISNLIQDMLKTKLLSSVLNTFLTILFKKVRDNSPDSFTDQSPGVLVIAAREPKINSDLVRYLLESKISPDHTDNHKQPLLQLTMQSPGEEQSKKVRLLLDSKADPGLVNWAHLVDNTEISRLILDFYPNATELYRILFNLPLSILQKINWWQEIGNCTLFEFFLNLIPKDLDAGYLEKLLDPAIVSTLIWRRNLSNLLKIASCLLSTIQLERLQKIYAYENNSNLLCLYVNSLVTSQLNIPMNQTLLVVKDILELSIEDINRPDEKGVSGVAHAVTITAINPFLPILIEAGGNSWIRDNQGKNALDYAEEAKNSEAIQILIKSHWEELPILIWAVTQDDADLIKKLIYHNVNINQKDSEGRTALMAAAEFGSLMIVKLLLAVPEIDLNLQNYSGATAVVCAVVNKKALLLPILIEAGANPWIKTTTMLPLDALGYALKHKNQTAINILICSKWNNLSILIWVVSQNDIGLVKQLIKCKVDVNLTDSEGRTPLMVAVKLKFAVIVELLLAAGANPLAKDPLGQTAFSHVQEVKDSKINKMLINCQWQSLPLLIKAASDNNLILVQQLLAMKANVNQVDDHKKSSALMVAASQGYIHIMDELLHANANVELIDSCNKTAMSHAVESGQSFAVDRLESHVCRYAIFGGISNSSDISSGIVLSL